ncbi:adenylyltransferase/cytidyltransferase family protein [Pseudomonas japonica]|uniref:adenylyltransferase/cytidyltransferase family protein n=1 Tax=Pseudomonas japonica TaxID=256466 RepID=UPI0015E2C80E|nr:adenylyltransferase/cytidyltransferase family protein [Pseudomonas japonica]MBA1287707.1 adenylyltransferase/cytidyltransferase family protein [Pseudomonas japonica]
MLQRTVITYGTFDLFHIGHLRLLQRLSELGDRLIVGVSTDEFNASKGKKCIIPFDQRIEIVSNLRQVHLAIPESNWDQKASDIQDYNVSVFGMGDDWRGKFDHLNGLCEVVYLDRTKDISSSYIKTLLADIDSGSAEQFERAIELAGIVAKDLR